MKTIISLSSALILSMSAAQAESWTLDGANSHLAFGSVKNDYIGEVHSFGALTGTVGEDGAASIMVDLTSVQTNIDIRNERMGEYVFAGAAMAELTAQIDMAAMTALAPGDSMTMELEADLGFLGDTVPVFVDIYALRLTGERVLVTTNGMLYLTTDELGIDQGIDVLQDLAGLDSITRSVPITFRLMFDAAE